MVDNKNPGSNTAPGCGVRIRGTNNRPQDPINSKKEKEDQLPYMGPKGTPLNPGTDRDEYFTAK